MRPTMLFVFAFFVACASAPTTLQRGTLTRPPPARPRPGVGAPVHDPRAPHPSVEPGPRPTRVLPQTPEARREPGIWASTDPDIRLVPSVEGVILPSPYPPTDEDAPFVQRCANVLNDVFAHRAVQEAYSNLLIDERLCAIATTYTLCVDAYRDLARHLSRAAEVEQLDRLSVAGSEFRKSLCADARSTGSVNKFTMLFSTTWRGM
jgi:hypothetical protein